MMGPNSLRQYLLSLPTSSKRFLGLALDLVLIPLALWLAFLLRLGFDIIINPLEYWWLFIAAPATAIPIFIRTGLYRAVLRYMGRDAISTIFKSVSVAALLLALVIYWARSDLLIPRTLVFNYWILLFALIGGSRFLARSFLVPGSGQNRFLAILRPRAASGRRGVAIYGAGVAGYQLYRSIESDASFEPVAFIDDDPRQFGRMIGALRVFPRSELAGLIERTGLTEVFLAIPSLKPSERSEILAVLENYPVHVRTVPSVKEITSGSKHLEDLEEIRVEDIIGRDVVTPNTDLMEKCILGKIVMVTGAGGSIGAELCRQALALTPRQLILFDHSEFNLFSIEEELRELAVRVKSHCEITAVLGSILNAPQLERVMSAFAVDTIYHAAAYKHVPIVERNIAAGIRNNVFGTFNTANAALKADVSDFVLISTDKAVRPTNVMGASKRVSELVLQGLAELPRRASGDAVHGTRFSMVRFGNVVGSSGSVVPKFRAQIEAGGPVTVTHPEVTRYFMTIPEAAQLVLQASAMAVGGDVFVLDMGEPVKISELAEKMIRLSGMTPAYHTPKDGEIEIIFTGLRPGEKLFEELLIGASTSPTGHPKILRATEEHFSWPEVEERLEALASALDDSDLPRVVRLLEETVAGFDCREIFDWTLLSAESLANSEHQPRESAEIIRLGEAGTTPGR